MKTAACSQKFLSACNPFPTYQNALKQTLVEPTPRLNSFDFDSSPRKNNGLSIAINANGKQESFLPFMSLVHWAIH